MNSYCLVLCLAKIFVVVRLLVMIFSYNFGVINGFFIIYKFLIVMVYLLFVMVFALIFIVLDY